MATLAPRLMLCLASLPMIAQAPPAKPAAPEEAALPEVKVKAARADYKPEASESPKRPEPLLDTPQSITVIPKAVLHDEGVTTLRDALRNVAGISLAAGEAGAQGDNLTLRGFTARNDIYLDGTRDFGSYYRDPFNLEAVEVVKGPASTMFGRGSTGGVVNQVSKAPNLKTASSAELTGGTDDTRRTTVDLNLALGPTSALRLNVMAHDADVADRDQAENRRFGFAPSLAFGLGTETRLTFDYFHQSENDIPDYGLPWAFDHPAPVSRNLYYGFKDSNYLRTAVDQWTVRVEHDFSDAITIRDQVRYAHDGRNARITEPQMPATATPGTALDTIQVVRNQIAVDSMETMLWNQLDLTFRHSGQGARNTLVLGAEGGRETSDPTKYAFTGVPTTALLAPNENDLFAGTAAVAAQVTTVANSKAVYAQDTLALGEHWELIGGLRWDRFDVNYQQTIAPALAFATTNEMTSWRACLVYKPVKAGSIYLSAGTSFDPSAESLSLTAATGSIPPEKNRATEAGTKWDFLDGRLSFRGAVYHMVKLNAKVPDPADSALDILGGNQQVNGGEVELAGRITEHWQIYTGWALASTKVVATTLAGTLGNPLPNAPRDTFNLWTTYEVSPDLTLGGGANCMSLRVASSTDNVFTGNLQTAPGYWTFNAMARYRLSPAMEVRANLANAANRYYMDLLHPGHVVPGAGRTLLMALAIRL